MNIKVRPAALSSAFVVVALGVLSASAQLNPTVKVLPKPQTSVPPECEQGLAPAVPRVIVAETENPPEQPARAVPPPSLDLKTQLRTVQVAAERGDRDAFKSALADSRAVVAAYPAGGERNAANDVVSVYSDLERLWDYQFTSPTGAFFDASTDFVTMMRRYPDYARSIADQSLTVKGQTLYPTDETRRFLVSEAARRLNNLGVRTPTRIAEVPPPPPKPTPRPQPKVVPAPVPKPAPKVVEKPAKPAPKKTAVHKTTTTHKTTPHTTTTHKTKPKPPVKIAEAKKPVAAPVPVPVPTPPPAPQPQPQPQPKPQPKEAVPPPMPTVTPPPAPKPAPVPVPTPEPVPVAVPAPAPKPTETMAPLPTDTMSTTTTAAATTTTTEKPAEKPAAPTGRVNLLFAIILIIVGIGVLIVLFRASD